MKSGEIMRFQTSRKMYMPVYLMIAVLLFLVIYIKFSGKPLNPTALFGAFLFSIIGLFITEMHRKRDIFHITPEYIEHHSGFISKDIKKIHVNSITDISSKQNIWERILGYGSITMQSSSGASSITAKNIENPGKFLKTVESKIQI